MQARCFCPKHGKLDFDNIIIQGGLPTCKKCRSTLEFGKVVPRRVEKAPKKKKRKRRKTKTKKKK